MMNVVLEGPDGTGKTTLALKLLQALPTISTEAR